MLAAAAASKNSRAARSLPASTSHSPITASSSGSRLPPNQLNQVELAVPRPRRVRKKKATEVPFEAALAAEAAPTEDAKAKKGAKKSA